MWYYAGCGGAPEQATGSYWMAVQMECQHIYTTYHKKTSAVAKDKASALQ